LRKSAPTSGEECRKFEEELASFCGTRYARVVSNGTAALFLSVLAAGLGKGDEVITTPLTWIASAAAAETLGAKAVLVDIDRRSYNIDPAAIEKAVTRATKAIVPVHLYGQCCDMEAILRIAGKHGLAVIEDACHALGAERAGRKAGSFGMTGCFSFHEQKNISTLGEGGMVTTNDPAVNEKVALYRSHCTRVYGENTKYCRIDESKQPMGKRFWYQDFDDAGYNFRMTDIQAAVGRAQLKKLPEFNRLRGENARYLMDGLKGIPGIGLPAVMEGNTHVFHLFPVTIDKEAFGLDKDSFIYAMLYEKGIKVGIHYIPLHYSTAFAKRGYKKGQFPAAEYVADRLVTLPLNPRQTKEALDYMIASIRDLHERAR
jgi:dTDP-4-amino-4,6-dideoxygalactose transaminase